jgi:hypothetical protein
MSCETNGNKVGKIGAAVCGISSLPAKFGNAYGAMLDRAAENKAAAGPERARRARAVLDVVDREGSVANLMRSRVFRGAALGAGVAGLIAADERARARGGALPSAALGKAGKAILFLNLASSAAGDIAGRASRRGGAGTVTREKPRRLLGVVPLGTSRSRVKLWSSSLTDRLNRLDWGTAGPLRKGEMLSSDGVMFKARGITWHRGTSTVRTPEGEERTITHLQSLALPATHYYFDRAITDEQAVQIANGKTRPESVLGYVGTLSRLEALTPGWGRAKTALIYQQLHYGERESASTTRPRVAEKEGALA